MHDEAKGRVLGAQDLKVCQLHNLPERYRNIVPILRKFPVFEEVSEQSEALEKLVDYMIFTSYKPGDYILKEGVVDHSIYFLLEGRVEIFKTTGSGDRFKVAEADHSTYPYFGEGGILDVHKRSASIVAADFVMCLLLNRSSFELYCEEYPQYGLPIIRFIARKTASRLRKVSSDFVFLYHAYVKEIRGNR